MGRWRASYNLARLAANYFNRKSFYSLDCSTKPATFPFFHLTKSGKQCIRFDRFSAIPSASSIYGEEADSGFHKFNGSDDALTEHDEEAITKIPIKAYFPCTSINLKSLQAEYSSNVIPTSRPTNYVTLRFCKFPLNASCLRLENNISCCIYMVVFQYGSTIMFNVDDHEVECYLDVVRRHSSGFLSEMKKDDYIVKEKSRLTTVMEGGLDYIILRSLDLDSIRIIGSVLGQSIALDYFVSQIDGILEEFTDINLKMKKTGTFIMNQEKLFQLMGKTNSRLEDVIFRVGLFERSEIAWRDAKYAEIYEYLREEYEITQRFGNLDYKLNFVERNIHFLRKVLQNRRSDIFQWCIIFLWTIDNVLCLYVVVHESTVGSV